MQEPILRVLAFLGVALAALLTVRFVPKLPGLRGLKPEVSEGRLMGIDGIRGFLALAVLVHHALRLKGFYASGDYNSIPLGVLEPAGEFAVSVFFGITGYLFWSRSLVGKIKAGTLYKRRFWRIYPLYAGLILVTVVLGLTHQPWIETPNHLSKTLVKLIVPGPGIDSSINGFTLDIGQVWTLFYEICFYLALPALALLARWRWTTYPLALLALGLSYFLQRHPLPGLLSLTWIALPLFAAGMVSAAISKHDRTKAILGGPIGSCLMIAVVVARFAVIHPGYGLSSTLAMFATLLPLVCGANLFGLLSRRVCRELGEISYSLYMVHILVLRGFLAVLDLVSPIRTMPETIFWSWILSATVIVVAVCLVTFRFLELPFLGRKPLPGADAAP